MSFSFSKLHPDLARAAADLGFSRPTPIQSQAIPAAMAGRDVLACAMTGSGKTAAFLVPILERLRTRHPGTTRALVLSPTRELAAQIVDHFNELARYTNLRAAAIYGGVGMGPQEAAFKKGVDVLVGCPGRLLDHFQQAYAALEGLEVLVLDEADRMLDMGFLPDVRRVLGHLPPVKQKMLFSATLPAAIVELAQQMLRNPARFDVERPSAPATGVSQRVYPVRGDLKKELLLALLEKEEIDNVLVFTRTKHRANRLATFLERRGISCDKIHGNRSQPQRTKALADFKNGKTQVLVATDIAARGIDVEALSHVVNFDVPNMPEDYIHRVGRTARAEATGDAFTFVAPEETGELKAIERALGKSLPRHTVEGFNYDAAPAENLEIPIAERIATIRARKADERARARAKADNKSETASPREGSRTAEEGSSRRRRPRRSRGGAGRTQREGGAQQDPRGAGSQEGRSRQGGRGQGAGRSASGSRGQDSRGQGQRGPGNRGQDSRGQGSRGQSSRGQDSRGQDSRGQGSRGQGSRSQGHRGQGPRSQGSLGHGHPSEGRGYQGHQRHADSRPAPSRYSDGRHRLREAAEANRPAEQRSAAERTVPWHVRLSEEAAGRSAGEAAPKRRPPRQRQPESASS